VKFEQGVTVREIHARGDRGTIRALEQTMT
jgi:hypothetical protein